MRIALLLALLLVLPLLLLAACDSGGTTPLSDSGPVLGAIPWTTPETARYNIRQGDTTGTGELSILAGQDTLVFVQNFAVPENNVTDEITAQTDPKTLRPIKVQRVIKDPDFQRECIATYSNGAVTVLQRDENDEHTDQLSLPTTHYDSWTDLFLWRTLDFSEGYTTRYADVLSCNPRQSEVITMVLEVKGIEQVTVPAGLFEAWHLKIESGSSKQDAWYSTDPSRILVKYDNGPQLFELVSVD